MRSSGFPKACRRRGASGGAKPRAGRRRLAPSRPLDRAAAMHGILAMTLDLARRGELVISGSLDGAACARLGPAELDLVVAASPSLDVLHLRDGRRIAEVEVGFAAACGRQP
jgi:hypothetical protein